MKFLGKKHTSVIVGSEILNSFLLLIPPSLYLLHTYYTVDKQCGFLAYYIIIYLDPFLLCISEGLSEGSVVLGDESPLQI